MSGDDRWTQECSRIHFAKFVALQLFLCWTLGQVTTNNSFFVKSSCRERQNQMASCLVFWELSSQHPLYFLIRLYSYVEQGHNIFLHLHLSILWNPVPVCCITSCLGTYFSISSSWGKLKLSRWLKRLRWESLVNFSLITWHKYLLRKKKKNICIWWIRPHDMR